MRDTNIYLFLKKQSIVIKNRVIFTRIKIGKYCFNTFDKNSNFSTFGCSHCDICVLNILHYKRDIY